MLKSSSIFGEKVDVTTWRWHGMADHKGAKRSSDLVSCNIVYHSVLMHIRFLVARIAITISFDIPSTPVFHLGTRSPMDFCGEHAGTKIHSTTH